MYAQSYLFTWLTNDTPDDNQNWLFFVTTFKLLKAFSEPLCFAGRGDGILKGTTPIIMVLCHDTTIQSNYNIPQCHI